MVDYLLSMASLVLCSYHLDHNLQAVIAASKDYSTLTVAVVVVAVHTLLHSAADIPGCKNHLVHMQTAVLDRMEERVLPHHTLRTESSDMKLARS